jgi:hypothetical protein
VTDLLERTPSGLVLPRVCHYPPAPYTSGPEFTELALSAGLPLDDWQAWVLDLGLGELDDGSWASFQNTVVVSRQNGKDAIFEALGLGWLFLTGEKLIGHSAHEYKTAMEAFRRIVSLIENTDDLRRRVKKIINTNGEEGVELLPTPTIIAGSSSLHTTISYIQRMRFLARSKGAGRGFSFDKMIWNEAYALVAAQVDAVLPTMSARPNPQLWLGSSPPLDAATGEALFRARRAAADGAEGVMFLDWGMEASLDAIGPCADPRCTHQAGKVEGCILDDERMHRRTNPAYPHRITRKAIRRERATMDPPGFARERGGAWPPDLSEGYTVISKRQWEAMADTDSGIGDVDAAKVLVGRPVFALSVSPRTNGRVRSSISLAMVRADGVRHVELVVSGPGTVWVPGALAALKHRWNSLATVADPGSPAGSVIGDIEAQKVDVTPMSSRDVAQAFGLIYDSATSENEEDRNVAHLGQSEGTLAVQGAGKRQVGEGHTWDTRSATADITVIDSMTKALWGLATQTGDVPVDPWVMYA